MMLPTVQCERCGATWINGVHYWRTGKPGNELDLAGLVCNPVNDPRCPNRMKGQSGGQTWEQRRAFIDGASAAMEGVVNRPPCK
jgi:hypothetical protein